uniref:Ig-like domain-containing protein n=1 Tax=Anas zonorhyncha TaxID=75864 RepID=A0A8B9UK65_9AVES
MLGWRCWGFWRASSFRGHTHPYSLWSLSTGTVQGDEIQPTRTTVWGQAGQTETLQCTYSSNASYIYVAWYRQHPNGSLQYLLQSKGRGGSYIHTAPFARKRFSGKADESSGTLFIHALELKDNALYYCTLQGPQ